MSTDIEKIIPEFKARGFIPIDQVTLSDDDSYIKTVNCSETLILPKTFWHNINDKERDLYIYKALEYYGLPGYTQSCPAGLEKRK